MKVVTKIFPIIMLPLIVLLLAEGCKKIPSEPVITPMQENPLCHPEITAYNFGVEHYAPHKQVRILDSLGMDGVFVRISPTGGVQELTNFFKADLVLVDSFNVYNVFAYLTLTDSVLKQQQIETITSIYEEIEFRETQLQIIFLGPNEDPTSAIAEVADIANTYSKDLIIYPHYETSKIESAEEALTYIQAAQKTNVFLAVHLCHELAAGNANRMHQVVANVAPYIKAVSISGATMSEFSNTTLPNWYWGIKPLYMGDYDLNPFYKALFDNHYNGPIAIHTWGIYNNFGLTPEEHLPLSKKVIEQLASDVCE